jgi:hypothetical protein
MRCGLNLVGSVSEEFVFFFGLGGEQERRLRM